ncbi:NAD(P)H-hydrate dehydratase [Radicibacter daui]|uniref:NAD(P)H-hydrate dehydratase n=1 Tax=Radicibacter daui TaxID=3064829 RepID=UPI004046C7FB
MYPLRFAAEVRGIREVETGPELPLALLDPQQMYAADAETVRRGTASYILMQRAGAAVAAAIQTRFECQPVLVLCGPGNNGGDGFVAAAYLRQAGWPVRVHLLCEPARLGGDAAMAAQDWASEILDFPAIDLADKPLIVDAIFGAGLSRAPDAGLCELFDRIAARGLTSIAIDVPSGLDGSTGVPAGACLQARMTIGFFRPRPGQLLMPGRQLCGDLEIADIGIAADVADLTGAAAWLNTPALWRHALRWPGPRDHKYTRGHVLVVAGPMTGAGRLAGAAAQRAGAGMVTLHVPGGTTPLFAEALPSAVVQEAESEAARERLESGRLAAILHGPGAGRDPSVAAKVGALCALGRPLVLDADALTSFAGNAGQLWPQLPAGSVLTPHGGEFSRLFPDLADLPGGKLAAARQAAARSGAVVIFKGYDTVIAAPDGRAAINANAPATLAVAGSGDVLAGIVLALLGAGMPAFEAAAAAVWIHAEAARLAGLGLVAEDLPGHIAPVLRALAGFY